MWSSTMPTAARARSARRGSPQLGVRAAAFQADFTQVEGTQQLARQAIDFLGGLDILVNNAGITLNMPFEKVTVEQFDTLYHVNIRALFFVIQACLPALLQSGKGVIVNTSSIHALQAMQEHSVYAGTKGAIISSPASWRSSWRRAASV